MDVVFRRSAERELLALSRDDRDRVNAKIDAYAADPEARHHDVVALVSRTATFRLRVGDWRVVFIREPGRIVIWRNAHRREVYR